MSRKGVCRNPRGIFLNKVPGEFCGGFFGGFFLGAFFLGKNPKPRNPWQNSNQNLRVSRPKSTLQGSGLDHLGPSGPKCRKESETRFWGFLAPGTLKLLNRVERSQTS